MTLEGAERIDEFMNKAQVFFLATVDGDKPKNRPLGFHLLKDGKLYFGVGNHKDVYKQMETNPNVEIVALVETDFLRYYGKAVFEETYDFADSLVAESDFLKSIYNDEVIAWAGHVDNDNHKFANVCKVVPQITNGQYYVTSVTDGDESNNLENLPGYIKNE